MAASARTFQILYISRCLYRTGKAVTEESIADFIAEKRALDPVTYSKAYVSPSKIEKSLHRMVESEGLFKRTPHSAPDSNLGLADGYVLTLEGSRRADLVNNIDACTTEFIENYKEKICRAALWLRNEQGAPQTSIRQMATMAGMSQDTVRRGLLTLKEKGFCIADKSTQPTLYTLTQEGIAIEFLEDLFPGADAGIEYGESADTLTNPLSKVLAEFDESDLMAPEGPVAPLFDTEGADIADVRSAVDITMQFHAGDSIVIPETKENQTSEDPQVPEPDDEWGSVNKDVREGHFIRAKACGMSLNDYFDLLNHTHERLLRRAVMNPYGVMAEAL